ncbi:MAG: hypothetical protein ACJ71Z_07670 [Aeromicrobium sp.]
MNARPRSRYVLIAVVAIAALTLGLVGPHLWGSVTGGSAKDHIAADPQPRLFSEAEIRPADDLVAAQQPIAHKLMQNWWASHGTKADDAAFLSWLQRHFPEPPSKADRRKELPQLKALRDQHTKEKVAAAFWLEAHGKKDIWKLYAHDQAEWLPSKDGDARKADVKALLKLSKKAQGKLTESFRASSPYVLDRSLNHKSADNKSHQVVNGCPCSYPSKHAARAAAARMYLAKMQPHMTAQYRWMEDEIDWSRIYVAGHLPSDIAGGALLGDMIGEYYLVTHGMEPAPKA